MPRIRTPKDPAKSVYREIVSVSEFARRMQCSINVVRKALNTNKIIYIDSDKKLIDWQTQSNAFRLNRDVTENISQSARPTLMTPKQEVNYESMASARLSKEKYTAKLKQLEYEQASGLLWEKDKVKTLVFKFCRVVRDGVLTIPERVAASLAAKIESEVVAVIKKELGDKQAQAVSKKLKGVDYEHIINLMWQKESVDVLENIMKGPRYTD